MALRSQDRLRVHAPHGPGRRGRERWTCPWAPAWRRPRPSSGSSRRIVEREVQGYEKIVMQRRARERCSGSWAPTPTTPRLPAASCCPPFEERIDRLGRDQGHAPRPLQRRSRGGRSPSVSRPGRVRRGQPHRHPGQDRGPRPGQAHRRGASRDLIKREIPEITEPSIDLAGRPAAGGDPRSTASGCTTWASTSTPSASEIKAAVDGVAATKYRTGGSEYDILVILPEADRSELPALDRMFVDEPGRNAGTPGQLRQLREDHGPDRHQAREPGPGGPRDRRGQARGAPGRGGGRRCAPSSPGRFPPTTP
ncbi:MAG: hypothetical protein MZV70_69570 [Desulfobacterales bacterium]|nr:hypothetical protein [Desulfobacterales bacterium]